MTSGGDNFNDFSKKSTYQKVQNHQIWVTGGLHPLEGVCIKATLEGVSTVNLSQGGLHPQGGLHKSVAVRLHTLCSKIVVSIFAVIDLN